MSKWLVASLNEELKIVNVVEANSHGEATRIAQSITDSGSPARIVNPENVDEVAYYYNMTQEQRILGFVTERGAVPNGGRKNGGARNIGRMIYPTEYERRQEQKSKLKVITFDEPSDETSRIQSLIEELKERSRKSK